MNLEPWRKGPLEEHFDVGVEELGVDVIKGKEQLPWCAVVWLLFKEDRVGDEESSRNIEVFVLDSNRDCVAEVTALVSVTSCIEDICEWPLPKDDGLAAQGLHHLLAGGCVVLTINFVKFVGTGFH